MDGSADAEAGPVRQNTIREAFNCGEKRNCEGNANGRGDGEGLSSADE